MKRIGIAVASALALSANASPELIPTTWPEFKNSSHPEDKRLVASIAKMKWYDACRAWGQERRSKTPQNGRRSRALLEFVSSENLINGIDLMYVAKRQVDLGMTACGVIASLGLPNAWNSTKTVWGTNAQMVYRDRGLYVYTEGSDANGIVRTIQE